MNEFTIYIKEGLNINDTIYKSTWSKIKKVFEVLSSQKYTKEKLQFHFEIRIDSKDFKWGDSEGVSNIKFFKKKKLIASTITLEDWLCENEIDVYNYIFKYTIEAMNLMLKRVKKDIDLINEEKLLIDFKDLMTKNTH